jgi:hypothetical protein
MTSKLALLILLLAVSSYAVAPARLVWDCEMHIRISDGRTLEGYPVRSQQAEFLLPCVTKEQIAKVIGDLGYPTARKTEALEALNRASKFRLSLVPEVEPEPQE